jgi:hypothetical protein
VSVICHPFSFHILIFSAENPKPNELKIGMKRNISDFYVNLRVEVAAVSRNRYGVEKTVGTHKILINAIKFYDCLQEI